MMTDDDILNRVFQLAEIGRGRTSPNPMVGAVVVNAGKIVGEGYHHLAGEPHAEVLAIAAAGPEAAGADLYVTLEPCCVTGRTPPCTDLIISTGIEKVIIGAMDPNPDINGNGIKALVGAGIKTRVLGEWSDRIARQNEVFFKFITTKETFVTAKMAMTIDGKIAAAKGRRWQLTGDEAGRDVHNLRDQTDAVMVGIDTVICDNPLLTTRIAGEDSKNPVRIIVDTMARLPLDSRIVRTADDVETFVATAPDADPDNLKRLVGAGINIITVSKDGEMLDLAELLKRISELNLTSLLLEGGSRLFGAFAGEKLIDKYIFFIAPIMNGWEDGVGMINLKTPLNQKFRFDEVLTLGDDIKITAYPDERV